ncbi:MAG TPA: extracellular solute-binding protein [Polyangia bacterium]|jgi:ABC-type molybdate transport system, periplasmic component|nr:extracellular solute-binding protein [Polyangia bacterium]
MSLLFAGWHSGLGYGLLGLVVVTGCRRPPAEIVVFHATSLTAVLGDAVGRFQRDNPRIRVRLEPSGSQVAARKVAELGMRADIVAVADAGIIGKMMVPRHAAWNAVFATNEIVLAHKDHSRFTDEITTQNWPSLLGRPGVRLGRADPDTAPLGYHTLLAWQLAEKSGTYGDAGVNLAARLADLCTKEHVTLDEAELLTLLEARAVDYAFLFRSTAEDHHLKITALPADQNLSQPELADRYASASVEVRMKQAEGKTRITGGPITYGLTIPAGAPHAAEARRFVAMLLGEGGRRLLERRGFRPAKPAWCSPCTTLPEELSSLLVARP